MAEAVDVLFINPGDRQQIYQDLGDEFCGIEPPAFGALFATFLRKQGLGVALIDGPASNISAEEIAKSAIDDFQARLIVIVVYGNQPSASSQTMTSAGAVARHIKDGDPHARILMTGTHLAALPERTMLEEPIDFVCDLEGPVTIHKTFEALKAGDESFADVPSLWWRDEGQIIKPRSAEPLITDLDGEMPGIAWDLLPMDRYRSHNWHAFDNLEDRSYASMHTSLGCPYKCSFCCINAPFGKSSYRMWSPRVVVDEIAFLVETYGIKNIKFVDEMFVLNKRHVLEVCDLLIERDLGVNIWAYARVDTVQDQFLDKLKAAGFNWLCLGIESASDNVRDGALKKFENEDIIDVVRRIQDAGIYILGNFIFGLPDDTMERMQSTLDLALELNCEFANFYSAMAYPGSPLYAEAAASGGELPSSWHQFSQHAYDTLPLANAHCTSADILEFRDQAWQTYFTDLNYLSMVRRTFGDGVVENIERMVKIPLPRRIVEEKYAA